MTSFQLFSKRLSIYIEFQSWWLKVLITMFSFLNVFLWLSPDDILSCPISFLIRFAKYLAKYSKKYFDSILWLFLWIYALILVSVSWAHFKILFISCWIEMKYNESCINEINTHVTFFLNLFNKCIWSYLFPFERPLQPSFC